MCGYSKQIYSTETWPVNEKHLIDAFEALKTKFSNEKYHHNQCVPIVLLLSQGGVVFVCICCFIECAEHAEYYADFVGAVARLPKRRLVESRPN